jgi:hypothetical protein
MAFYLYLNGAERGPFTEEQVRAYVADGLLQPSDLASDQGGVGWKPLANFARFAPAPSVSAPTPVAPPIVPPAVAAAAAATPSAAAAETAPPVRIASAPRVPVETLGPYARATLAPNEMPCFKTSLHWIIFIRFGLLAVLAVLFVAIPFAIGMQALTGSELGWFALPLPAFILVPPTLAWISSELVITDRRVLIKTGIIRRQTLEMFVAKVESIAIDQGFLGRMLDYGSVIIRGTGGLEEPFEAIARPLEFRHWVQRLQHGGQAAAIS